jgi:hypothetical protein
VTAAYLKSFKTESHPTSLVALAIHWMYVFLLTLPHGANVKFQVFDIGILADVYRLQKYSAKAFKKKKNKCHYILLNADKMWI